MGTRGDAGGHGALSGVSPALMSRECRAGLAEDATSATGTGGRAGPASATARRQPRLSPPSCPLLSHGPCPLSDSEPVPCCPCPLLSPSPPVPCQGTGAVPSCPMAPVSSQVPGSVPSCPLLSPARTQWLSPPAPAVPVPFCPIPVAVPAPKPTAAAPHLGDTVTQCHPNLPLHCHRPWDPWTSLQPRTRVRAHGHRGTLRDTERHGGTWRDMEGHQGMLMDMKGHGGTRRDTATPWLQRCHKTSAGGK